MTAVNLMFLFFGAMALPFSLVLFVAASMSFEAGPSPTAVPLAHQIVGYGLVWGSIFYPAVYFAAVIVFLVRDDKGDKAAVITTALPLLYLVTLALFHWCGWP